MDFDSWLNQVPEKKPTKVELNSRREMLTMMYDDLNRMLSDCDIIHPDDMPSDTVLMGVIPTDLVYTPQISASEDISNISPQKDIKHPLYNNNMYEEEWELYKGVAIDED